MDLDLDYCLELAGDHKIRKWIHKSKSLVNRTENSILLAKILNVLLRIEFTVENLSK